MAANNSKWSSTDEQLLKLLSDGFAIKEIADKLKLSQGTVHYHASRMYMKLGAANAANAVAIAFRRGMLK